MRTLHAKKKIEIQHVVLYMRVSTPEQAEKDLSIPAQRDAMRRYCETRGYKIIEEYIEPGATATDDNRPVFRQMITDVLKPGTEVNAILVFQSSRFMRNALRARAYKEKLRRHGVRVIAIQQETTDDPHGRLVEQMFEVLDQYESEVNGVRTSAAMRENAKQGNFNGSRAPYGFKVEKYEIRPGVSRGKLVPHPLEVDTLREIFRLYVHGSGAKAVARELNQRGVRYRQGKKWSNDLVLKVIEEEAAIGTYYWGKRDHRTGLPNERSAWVPIAVDPILDPDLFAMAQRIRSERDPERRPGRTSSSPLLLAGLLRCGKCGAACTLETSGKRNDRGEYEYRYYNCRSFLRSGKEACPGYRIPVARLDQAILRHLASELFSEERCREILRDFVEETGILRQKTTEQRRQLEREVAELERRMARWEEAFETGEAALDVITPRIRELRAKRDELKAALAKTASPRTPPPHLYADTTIRRFQASIRELFSSASTSLTRNYLRMLVDRIVVTEGTIEVEGRTDAAVALMAASGVGEGAIDRPEQVLTTVVGWRPRRESNSRPTV